MMNSEKIVAWFCFDGDEITDSIGLADNWRHHGYSVIDLNDAEFVKAKEGVSVQRVHALAIPSLDPESFVALESALKILCKTRSIPLTYCEATTSFAHSGKAGYKQCCGQVDRGQTGEYPCKVCGLPQSHDA